MILTAVYDMAKAFYLKGKTHVAKKKWEQFNKFKLTMLDFIIHDSFTRSEQDTIMTAKERQTHRGVLES